jgi:hypothetical protein
MVFEKEVRDLKRRLELCEGLLVEWSAGCMHKLNGNR